VVVAPLVVVVPLLVVVVPLLVVVVPLLVVVVPLLVVVVPTTVVVVAGNGSQEPVDVESAYASQSTDRPSAVLSEAQKVHRAYLAEQPTSSV